MTTTTRAMTVAETLPALTMMRRVSVSMFVAGAVTSGIGVLVTQHTPRSQASQVVVAALLGVCGVTLAMIPRPSRRTMEFAAFVSIGLLGVLIGRSEPLGMGPIFFLWPVVTLAHFSSKRVATTAYAAAITSLALGLIANSSATLRVDTFIGTAVSVGLMGWLVASLTRTEAVLRSELAAAAETDPLTGLLNRRAFHPMLDDMVAEARARATPLTLVMFDLDHFKAVNDRHGHAVGDDVLRHVARSMCVSARDGDLIARLGGEEFAVVLPGATLDFGRDYATRAALAMAIAPEPVETLSTSAGICALDETITSSDQLLRCADQALYAAKDAGRGRTASWERRAIVGPPFAVSTS